MQAALRNESDSLAHHALLMAERSHAGAAMQKLAASEEATRELQLQLAKLTQVWEWAMGAGWGS